MRPRARSPASGRGRWSTRLAAAAKLVSAALQSSSGDGRQPLRQPVERRRQASVVRPTGDQPQQRGERCDEGFGRGDAAFRAGRHRQHECRRPAASGLSVSLTMAGGERARLRARMRACSIEIVAAAGLRDREEQLALQAQRAGDRPWRCSAPRPPPESPDSARSGACRRWRHGPSCRVRRSPRPAAAGAAAAPRARPAARRAPPGGAPRPAPRAARPPSARRRSSGCSSWALQWAAPAFAAMVPCAAGIVVESSTTCRDNNAQNPKGSRAFTGESVWKPNAPAPAIPTSTCGMPADILDAMIEGQFAAVAAVHAARPALNAPRSPSRSGCAPAGGWSMPAPARRGGSRCRTAPS